MLSIPLPLAVSAVLAFLLARLATDGRDWTRAKALFAALLGACAVHGALIAFFWGYGVAVVRPLLPVLASLLPLLAWLAFRSLAGAPPLRPAALASRLLPTAAIPILAAVWPPLIDLIVVGQFAGYGAALLRRARAGPDALKAAQLHRAIPAHRAMRWAGILLLANAAADLAILVDFQATGGRHVPVILGALSVGIVLGIGLLAIAGTQATGDDEEEPEPEPAAKPEPVRPPAEPDGEDARETEVLARADAALREGRLFTDPSLTLSRIARRAGVPARDISGAINRRHGMNVSQYVNRFRIEEACRLMETTDDTISNIHLDAGFQTKSNFNREFRRQMGVSPTEWRASRTGRPPPGEGRAQGARDPVPGRA